MTIDEQLLEEVARLEARVTELENENATLRLRNNSLENQGLLRRSFWQEARKDITRSVEERSYAERDSQDYRVILEEVYNDLLGQPENRNILDRIRSSMDKIGERRSERPRSIYV